MPNKTRKERRGEIFPDEMRSLVLGPGWLDGREGYLFCRIESQIDMRRMLRAEVTWNDDGEEREDDSKIRVYFDPEICLQSNRPGAFADGGNWVTLDAIHIPISGDMASLIVQDPAINVLRMFGEQIESLRMWDGGDDAEDA